MDVLWEEMGLQPGAELRRDGWERFMQQFIRRQAERDANMFVVMPSTPAQYFHVLRRQANLPYKRPLVVLTPKFLHHHRPATSALDDFTTGAAQPSPSLLGSLAPFPCCPGSSCRPRTLTPSPPVHAPRRARTLAG